MLRYLYIFILLWISTPVMASDLDQRAAAIEAAVKDWASENQIHNLTVTVFHRDQIMRTGKFGPKASGQIILASLSKSITGACLAQMVNEGMINWDTQIGTVFGERLHDLDIDSDHGGLTIEQLVTHSGGVYPDETQTRMYKWSGKKNDRHERVAARALARDLKASEYKYNNENYAILGAVIERVTGQRYDTYCNNAVLKPLGINSAKLTPSAAAFAAWGGWEMTTQDFARFVMGRMGADSNPAELPNVTLGGGAYYGLGRFWREGRTGHNYWHAGALCLGDKGEQGAYFAHWHGRWGAVVGWNKCIEWDSYETLDASLSSTALAE